jgi:hypothetical protein
MVKPIHAFAKTELGYLWIFIRKKKTHYYEKAHADFKVSHKKKIIYNKRVPRELQNHNNQLFARWNWKRFFL